MKSDDTVYKETFFSTEILEICILIPASKKRKKKEEKEKNYRISLRKSPPLQDT